MERELGPKISAGVEAAKAEQEKMRAELAATEDAALTEAKVKMKTFCETYRFKEALAAIQGTKVTLPDQVRDRDLLVRRVEWLVQFKDQLVQDLNRIGYTGGVQRRNGQVLSGGVARASDLQLDIKVQFGNVPIAWADLTPQSVLAMARSFIKPTLSPDVLADRQWQAGVFCIFTQLVNDSQGLMDEAAAVKEEYRFHKALFFGQPPPEPAASSPSAPAPEAPRQDAPPGTGVEMAEKPLNPSKSDMNESLIKGLRRPQP
jgi:hypothetical protein